MRWGGGERDIFCFVLFITCARSPRDMTLACPPGGLVWQRYFSNATGQHEFCSMLVWWFWYCVLFFWIILYLFLGLRCGGNIQPPCFRCAVRCGIGDAVRRTIGCTIRRTIKRTIKRTIRCTIRCAIRWAALRRSWSSQRPGRRCR